MSMTPIDALDLDSDGSYTLEHHEESFTDGKRQFTVTTYSDISPLRENKPAMVIAQNFNGQMMGDLELTIDYAIQLIPLILRSMEILKRLDPTAIDPDEPIGYTLVDPADPPKCPDPDQHRPLGEMLTNQGIDLGREAGMITAWVAQRVPQMDGESLTEMYQWAQRVLNKTS